MRPEPAPTSRMRGAGVGVGGEKRARRKARSLAEDNVSRRRYESSAGS